MSNAVKKAGKVTFVIIIVTIITKVLGAFRDLSLSYFYGSTNISDAYILATTLPVTIFAFIYEGISASFIPVYSKLNNKDEENKFTSNMINILFIITLLLVILVELFPEIIIKLFASGFSGETLETAIFFTRISILGVFFSSAVYIFVSYLNYNDSFISAAIRSIPIDITVILSIVISSKTNSLLPMAIGVPISLIIELLVLIPSLIKKKFRYSFVLKIKDKNILNVIEWSIPVIIATAISELNVIIDRQFSSWMVAGGISSLTYSSRIINVIKSTFFLPFITVLFPMFSKKIISGEEKEVSHLTSNVISMLSVISIPLTFGVICLATDIVAILFQRGAFDANATMITSSCLKFYAVSLFGCAINTVLTKVFYSMTDMKTPMVTSIIGVVINITFNLLFARKIGLGGLALATSISTTLISLMQYIVINHRLHLDNKSIFCSISKSLFSSIIMFAIVFVIRYYLGNSFSTIVSFLISSIVGIIAYFIIMIILKSKEVSFIFNFLKNRRRKNCEEN